MKRTINVQRVSLTSLISVIILFGFWILPTQSVHTQTIERIDFGQEAKTAIKEVEETKLVEIFLNYL
jgi:hypothetical protein